MPQKFKALATVTVWALFVSGWLAGLLTFIIGIMKGYVFGAEPAPMTYFASYAISIGFAFAGGFLMIVRKKLE
jgi:uncharacterized membrane protein